MLGCNILQSRNAPCNILEGSGPAAAPIANPAVVRRPHARTLLGQGAAHGWNMVKAELGEAATAMNEHDGGMRAGRFRQAQLAELQVIIAIAYAEVSDIRRQRLDLAP